MQPPELRIGPVFRGARAAVVFLTRVPVGGFPYTPAEWQWACAWFPGVGIAMGAVMAGTYLLTFPWGGTVAALLTLTVSVMMTGAFHEDGLADTADALGGGYTRDRVLEILKDSRVGTFGAVALILSLGLRVALIAPLGAQATAVLIASQALSRVTPIWLMVGLPYVSQGAAAKSRQVARAQWPQALLATTLGGVACAGLSWQAAAAAVALLIAVGALGAWRFVARTGGITGDFLGATQQVGEIAVLLALAGIA